MCVKSVCSSSFIYIHALCFLLSTFSSLWHRRGCWLAVLVKLGSLQGFPLLFLGVSVFFSLSHEGLCVCLSVSESVCVSGIAALAVHVPLSGSLVFSKKENETKCDEVYCR